MVDVGKTQRTSRMTKSQRRAHAQKTSVHARNTPISLPKAPWDEQPQFLSETQAAGREEHSSDTAQAQRNSQKAESDTGEGTMGEDECQK